MCGLDITRSWSFPTVSEKYQPRLQTNETVRARTFWLKYLIKIRKQIQEKKFL